MHIKSTWSYINKGLLIILSFLVVSSLASIIYLTQTLLGLRQLTHQGGSAVGTTFVLQDLLISTQQLQTSARGYILTGDKKFLEPVTESKDSISADLKTLRAKKGLDISQEQVDRISRLSSDQTALVDQMVTLHDAEGFEAAQALVASREGEEVLQDIRRDITTLSSTSLRNIGPMQRHSEANTKRALGVAAAMSILVLATCAAVIWYFKRAILHERALESTKNEFLSLASHQLRTPATNVKQYIGLLLDGYMGELNEKQRYALNVANRNNELEINIMNDLLDVAKLDLERIQLHKKVTNITKIARHVMRDHLQMASDKQQTIKLKSPKQVMASVDENYVKGVIGNLVDNAVKYSREGTVITIVIERVQDFVRIAVKDKGVGIKRRDYSKLFNKFSRLNNEFSANSEGSGLGLYWVKQIVRLHGGTIDVTSKEGEGTTFTVKLPVR